VALVVVYDACVLYPAPLRDLLLRIALTGLIRARWSDEILDECFASILHRRPDLKPEALRRTRELMVRAVPDCLVTGYARLVPSLVLPDPNDRHVLAAGIRAGAQCIVTKNLKDFPKEELSPYDIEATHPDDFVLGAIDLAPDLMASVVLEQAASLASPPRSVSDLLRILHAEGMVRTVGRLEALLHEGRHRGKLR